MKSRACPSFLLLLLVLPAAGHAGEAASAPAAEPELPRLVLEPVYALKEVDQAPTPISRQDATYPRTLRTRRIEGSVVVGFTINSKGTVLDAHAVSSTNEGFEQAAIDAVKKWRFKPGMKDGKPVSTKVEVTLTFSLKSL